ncbi:type II RES/Xre toxin-antitoxin system antitoxin [Sphingobacterium wenxiniae]|uniref:Putative toxin-antitoxin system antitoxin component, TIGR02293 family n=1 Tax=Sphingobacterium wenxiniae TaxID=683125 RepID=A0A1I6P8L9_9SPHI|nr:antitoxin Xre/MbcA/ParS toxin-binding domain-containing protein [Sphingobacterium wenxiniae]SFS36516.1 putative toxin-antitoxin system antitoxin component, TIGR02293 family [Sphingobacterium wenxiniae]
MAKSKKYNLEERLNKEVASFIHEAREPGVLYETTSSITYQDFLSDKMLIIKAIRMGVPYSLFNLIQDYTPFTESDWASLLDVSTKSLQRYKQSPNHHFKPLQSEKIIEIAEVTDVGLDVFGDMDKFKLWLNTPNYALGNLLPMELLRDSYGKELVLGELTRISHGILV